MSKFNVSKSKTVIFFAIISLIAFSVLFHKTFAGPGSSGGSGYGFIDAKYDSNYGDLVSIGGTADISPVTRLRIYSVPNNFPVNYGLRVVNQSSDNLLRVSTSGIVTIGTSTFSNEPDYFLYVNSVIGDVFSTPWSEYYYNGGYGNQCCNQGIKIGSLHISSTLTSLNPSGNGYFDGGVGRLTQFQSLSAGSLSITNNISADRINPGTFQGGGYYAFPGKLGVSTSTVSTTASTPTLSVYGDGFSYAGYFASSTYIKIIPTSISDPGALNVSSSPGSWLSSFNKGIRLDRNATSKTGHPVIAFGSGAGGSTYFGVGYKNDRLLFFSNDSDGQDVIHFPKFYNLTISATSTGIGIGERTPSSTLHVSGTLIIEGPSGFQLSTTTTPGYILTSNGSGTASWTQPPSGISNGVQDYTVRHNGAGWLGSGLLTNDGLTIKVSSTASNDNLTLLRVGSGGYFQFDKNVIVANQGECGSAYQLGRITFSSNWQKFYVCMGTAGWKEADFWHDTNWSNRKRISINRSKIIGTSTLSSFPVLVKVSSTPAMQDDCDDVVFYQEGGTTKLYHEIENQVGGETDLCAPNKEFIAWVNLNLNYSATTTLYMYYGNASAASQQNRTATWNSNYKLVLHLDNRTPTTYNESTSNGYNFSATSVTSTTTPWFRGSRLNGTNAYIYRSSPGATILDPDTTTYSAWVKFSSLSGSGFRGIVARANNNEAYNIDLDDSNDKITFFVRKNVWSSVSSTPSTVTTGQWYYVVLTHSSNTLKGYINGVLIGSDVNANAVSRLANSSYQIGSYPLGGGFLPGDVDEVRISNVDRGQDWIQTEYNNQSSPSTFYTIGAEE